jgi:hypothetical protein
MSGKQKRMGPQSGSGKVSDDIAGIPADLFSGIIDPNLRPKTFHFSLETESDVPLLAGETVDLDELNEEVLESVLVDQRLISKLAPRAVLPKRQTLEPAFRLW